MKILGTLFFTFWKIGLFSIGGGYAIIPMIHDEVVSSSHWLTAQEFTDIITISQMTPGPLAVNTSTFVGMRVAGLSGAVCATAGCICMGVLISLGLYRLFSRFSSSPCFARILRGLKSASLGLIAAAAAIILTLAFFGEGQICLSCLDVRAVFIFLAVFVLSRWKKPGPILLMLLSGVLGAVLYL